MLTNAPPPAAQTSSYIVHTWKISNFRCLCLLSLHLPPALAELQNASRCLRPSSPIRSPNFSLEGKEYAVTIKTCDDKLVVHLHAFPGTADIRSLTKWERTVEAVIKLRGIGKDGCQRTHESSGLQSITWTEEGDNEAAHEAIRIDYERLLQFLKDDELVVLVKIFGKSNDSDGSPIQPDGTASAQEMVNGGSNRGCKMDELFDDSTLADACLKVGDEEQIYVSRAILSLKNEYFRNMFKGVLREGTAEPIIKGELDTDGSAMAQIKSENAENGDNPSLSTPSPDDPATLPSHPTVIHIADPDPWAFRNLIRFLYTDKIQRATDGPFTAEEAGRLMRVADQYQAHSLRERALRQVINDVTPDTAVRFLFEFGHAYPDLRGRLLSYVVDNFAEVKETEAFKDILKNSGNYRDFPTLMMEILKQT